MGMLNLLKFTAAGGLCLLLVTSTPGHADKGIIVTGGNVTERNHWLVAASDGTYLLGYSAYTVPLAFESLYVQRLSANGTPIGAPWDLSYDMYFVASRSAAAYDPTRNQLMVAYETFTIGDPSRQLRLVAVEGTGGPLVSGHLVEFVFPDNSDVGAVTVAYNSLADEWLVVALRVDASDPDLAYIDVICLNGELQRCGRGFLIPEPQSLMRSVSLAYAPVATPKTRLGWYLLAVNRASSSTLYMLGEHGELIDAVWDCQQEPPVPVRLEIPFDWGTVGGHSYHPHVAYGEEGERKRFAVVWEDLNNTIAEQETTGIWGGWLDATHTRYCSNVPDAEAFYVGGSCWHNFYWWAPRVAFDPVAGQFLAAWRELPTNDSCNDVLFEHIRGQRFGQPLDNIVLSRATGPYPGVERPMFPDLASNGNGWLVTWDDQRNQVRGHQRDIYGRLFGGVIFADGFETGNTVRWAATAP